MKLRIVEASSSGSYSEDLDKEYWLGEDSWAYELVRNRMGLRCSRLDLWILDARRRAFAQRRINNKTAGGRVSCLYAQEAPNLQII